MLNAANIIGEIIYVLLSLVGINYADNNNILAHEKSAPISEHVAMQINFEGKFSKYSTKISASGLPTGNKGPSPKAKGFKKWRLTITP